MSKDTQISIITDDPAAFFKHWGIVKITTTDDPDSDYAVKAITHSTRDKIDLEQVIEDAAEVAQNHRYKADHEKRLAKEKAKKAKKAKKKAS